MVDEPNADRGSDRQYRLGFEQAWREWSSCIYESITTKPNCTIKAEDIKKMEVRLLEVQKR